MRSYISAFCMAMLLPCTVVRAVILEGLPATQTVQNGQLVNVDITVSDFTNIVGYQFSLSWDPAVVQFQAISNLLPGTSSVLNFNTSNTASGILNTAYVPGPPALTLPDGSVLFRLEFLVTGTAGMSTFVNFTQQPTSIEFYDENLLALPATLEPAEITIEASSGNLQLYASSATSCGTDTVCVDITVVNFIDIISGQFNLIWNPAVFNFTQYTNLNATLGINNSNFDPTQSGAGLLEFAWFDQNFVGFTLPDNAVLFSVCFVPAGSPGSSTVLAFSDPPNALEFTNSDGVIPVDTYDGTLTVGVGSSIAVCNDLVVLHTGDSCMASISADSLLEGYCPGAGADIAVLETPNGPVIASGPSPISFDASSYVGQTLYYQVILPNGGACWGDIEIQGSCSLCEGISASAIRNAEPEDSCCYTLQLDNQRPGSFAYLNLVVLQGAQLQNPVQTAAGWSILNFSNTHTMLVPGTGSIPEGITDVAQFCLKNPTTSPQIVEVQYFNSANELACTDTLTLTCTVCVQALVDSVYCKDWNQYGASFCLKAGEGLDPALTYHSVTLAPQSGVYFSADPPNITNPDGSVIVALPGITPGTVYCSIPVEISGATGGEEVCFYAILHEQDLTQGEPDLNCCTDTVPVCFRLPDCNPCNPEVTFAELEPANLPGDTCCWNITLHGPPNYNLGVGTYFTDPGWQLSTIANFPGSGWAVQTSPPFSTSHVYWSPAPPQSNYVQDGYSLPTVCVGGAGSLPPELVVYWLGKDSAVCRDTLVLNCMPREDGCVQVDAIVAECTGSGLANITLHLTNTSSPPVDAGSIELIPVGPGSVMLTPSQFPVPLQAGSSAMIQTSASGNVGSGFGLFVVLHELNDSDQHLNCCAMEDTLMVVLVDAIAPNCQAPPDQMIACENFDPTLQAYGQPSGADDCCFDRMEETTDYGQFDSNCHNGTITRIFTAIDCAGNTTTCSQQISMTSEENYFVHFPDDILETNCNPAGIDIGMPEYYGVDCEFLSTTFSDVYFGPGPEYCFRIERTWTVLNWCTYNPALGCIVIPNPNPGAIPNDPANLAGPVVSAPGTLIPGWEPTVAPLTPLALPTDFSTFWGVANCYQYTQIIQAQDVNVPTFDNEVFRLYQNRPNPWSNQTDIRFYQRKAGEATLVISDALGRTVYRESGIFPEGIQAFTLEAGSINVQGQLFYRLETVEGSGIRRMLKLGN